MLQCIWWEHAIQVYIWWCAVEHCKWNNASLRFEILPRMNQKRYWCACRWNATNPYACSAMICFIVTCYIAERTKQYADWGKQGMQLQQSWSTLSNHCPRQLPKILGLKTSSILVSKIFHGMCLHSTWNVIQPGVMLKVWQITRFQAVKNDDIIL